ncbi:MAG: hypothetical protein ACJ74Q_13295 [Pyrinomonadaceae bacterium]
MEETNRTFADDEGDETMVTPRFDNEETVLARPVVPFEDVGDAPEASATAAPPPFHTRLRSAQRRSPVAALVLASALGGSVLGVGGLYFYQKHRNADAAPAAEQQQQQQQADVTAPAAQPTAEAVSQSRETSATATEPSAPAPVASEPEVRADDEAGSARDKGSEKEKNSEKTDDSPAVARRNVSESRDPVAAPKHGKKGEHDEEPQREERRARRDDDDQPVRADDSGDDRREARRVGVITYRSRRARRDNYGNADRLRRIFEGQP